MLEKWWPSPDSDWTPSRSGCDAPGLPMDGSNHLLKSSTLPQSFILPHNEYLLELSNFTLILSLIRTRLSSLHYAYFPEKNWESVQWTCLRMRQHPGRAKLILGDRRPQTSAFCSSPSCWYGKMHVRHSFFRWAPPRNMALKTCHRMLCCKNNRRSSGGTLRQKFNLIDI